MIFSFRYIYAPVAAMLIGCGGGSAAVTAPLATPGEPEEPVSQDEYAINNNLRLKKFDLNRDDRPDIFKFHKPGSDGGPDSFGLLVRKEVDINQDGRIDVIQTYDDFENIVREEIDLDFDGRVDEVAIYEGGELLRKEIDTSYDGKPDVIRYYVGGMLERIESDRDQNGAVDTWEYYENDRLNRIGTDEDGDGKVDHWDHKQKAEAEAAAE